MDQGHDASAELVGSSGDALSDGDHAGAGHAESDVGGHGNLFAPQAGSAASLLTVLGYLRMAVYFSLGFGPVGLFALQTGSNEWTSMLWAVPSGLASVVLARKVFQFQQRDVDSSVTNRDLFFAKATVIVPIGRGQMGRVRVLLGQSTVDRYARAEKPDTALAKGESVYIVRVSDECVYVERPAPDKFGGQADVV